MRKDLQDMITKVEKEQKQEAIEAINSLIRYHLQECVLNAGKKGITEDNIYNTKSNALDGKSLADQKCPRNKLTEMLEAYVDWGTIKKRDDRYYNE